MKLFAIQKAYHGKNISLRKMRRGVEVYTDAIWEGKVANRRPVSGYYTFPWSNLAIIFLDKLEAKRCLLEQVLRLNLDQWRRNA